MEKIIISPPFSNYIKFNNTIAVLGTFTLKQRKGALLQFIKTFRKYEGGYINKIGLRNKGLRNVYPTKKDYNSIISIAALEYDDWFLLYDILKEKKSQYEFFPKYLELNVSCPNLNKAIAVDAKIFKLFSEFNPIVKLPPTDHSMTYLQNAYDNNISTFHLCNTIPTSKGGISGKLLKEKSLFYIRKAKELYQDNITIIGGGGIYSIEDVNDYLALGCNHISLSTVLLNPMKTVKIISYVNKL